MASVDAWGRCIVTTPQHSYVIGAEGRGGEAGWAGVTWGRGGGEVIVVREWFRDVAIWDGEVCVRKGNCVGKVGAVGVGEGGLVIGESAGVLSWWDWREGKRQGCVMRKRVGKGDVKGLDVRDGDVLVASGKVVYVVDARMGGVRNRWAGGGGIVGVKGGADGRVWVCGGNEVVSGRVGCGKVGAKMLSGAVVGGKGRDVGIRTDTVVVGLDVRAGDNGEEAVVVTESGAVYVLTCCEAANGQKSEVVPA